MNKPLLHPTTQLRLESFIAQPAHGLLLVGRPGTGRQYIAQWLAQEQHSQRFDIKPLDDKKTISIEQIRELYSITRTGGDLIVVIENADTMSADAQNAFLKLLEEPPKNTRFVLTADSSGSLLPTIRSRTQQVEVLPPPRKELLAYARSVSSLDEASLKSLLHTCEGLPGTFLKLLQNSELQEAQLKSVTEAKSFYTADVYSRHMICLEHKYDKEWSAQLLNLLALIVQSLLKQAAHDTQKIKKLKKQADLLEETSRNMLLTNGNPKVHLARLATQLG